MVQRFVLFGEAVLWHEFEHGGRHLTENQLERYRQVGDEDMDGILEALFEEGNPLKPHDDFLEIAEQVKAKAKISAESDVKILAFLGRYSTLPDWVDIQQLSRGQEVFLAYAPIIGATLFYRSLVPGFSISKIAAVLQATAYLAPPSSRESVQERLMDTGAFLCICMGGSVESLLSGGDGWKAAISVRVLHAKVRRRLLSRKGSRKWKLAELGVPINQEDMAATLLAFSVNALLGYELILGKSLNPEERRDYVALWRYLGWLLGVDVDQREGSLRPLDPCGPGWILNNSNSLEHSHAVFESIIKHLMTPDESSISIAHHLLRIGQSKPNETGKSSDGGSESFGWFCFRCLQCRRMIGDPLADALALPFHPEKKMRIFLMFCSRVYFNILRVYTVTGQRWSPFRRMIINFHRRKLLHFAGIWRIEHSSRAKERLSVERTCPFAMMFPTSTP